MTSDDGDDGDEGDDGDDSEGDDGDDGDERITYHRWYSVTLYTIRHL